MAIMELSKPNKLPLLFDPIRREWVSKTPEESVRQALLHQMIHLLEYPTPLLAVEKELQHLPHLQLKTQIPKRRIDIVVFAKGIHSQHALFPLLLIECKAVTLTSAVTRQVISYNEIVQAPFVALANEKQILTGCYNREKGHYCFEEGLPSYATLLGLLI